MATEKGERPDIAIREFAPGDAAKAAQILREARGAASWGEEALLRTTEMPGVAAYVSERDSTISGIVIGRRTLDEGEVLNLAVQEEMRRQGEGRALLKQVLERFAEGSVSRVFLEVRESNKGAIAFYQSLGFRTAGARKDYYQAPTEAATVMELLLGKSTD